MLTDQELLALSEEEYSTLTDDEIKKLEELKGEEEEKTGEDKDIDGAGDDDKNGDGKGDEDKNTGGDENKETDSEYEVLLKKKNWDNDGLAKGYSEAEKYNSRMSAENAELRKKIETKELEDKIKKELEEKNVDPEKLKEDIAARSNKLVTDLSDPEKALEVINKIIEVSSQRATDKIKGGELKGLLEEKEKRDEDRLNENTVTQLQKAVDTIAEKYYDGDKVKAEIHFKEITPKINEIFDGYSKRFKEGLISADIKSMPGSLNMVLAEALLATGLPKKKHVTVDSGQGKKAGPKVLLTSKAFSNMTEKQKKNVSDEDLEAALVAEKKAKL